MRSPGVNTQSLRPELLGLFPALREVPEPLLDEALASATVREMPAGTALFEPGNPCRGFPLVLAGTVRVVKTAPNGREVLLYTVHPGESCLLSSSCLLGGTDYSAMGIAKSAVRLVILPAAAFNKLLAESKAFRDYVFALFGDRLAGLMELVEAVAFQRLDQRLAALLLRKGSPIRATHQAIADELGSVREIVSRLLRSFEDRGWVALGRERIEITDAEALRAAASPS
jgi:CRP/FNR family transcriptional regulator